MKFAHWQQYKYVGRLGGGGGGGGGGSRGGADDKFVILLVKKGYGLVSAFSQSYHTRPPASCDTAGFTQIPGRIPFLQGG